MNAFTVEFEMRSLITNCNSSITRMTPCLEKAYDNLFGSDYNDMVSSKNLKQFSSYFYSIFGCFFHFQARRIHNLSNTQVEGKEALTALTGCKQPCESIDYNVIPLANWNMKFNRDPRAQGIFN